MFSGCKRSENFISTHYDGNHLKYHSRYKHPFDYSNAQQYDNAFLNSILLLLLSNASSKLN